MTHTITQQAAAEMLGITRQRVNMLVKAGVFSRCAAGEVLRSEVMQRKLNPPSRGVKGHILHIDMSSDPEMFDVYKSTGVALEVLRLHYETIKKVAAPGAAGVGGAE